MKKAIVLSAALLLAGAALFAADDKKPAVKFSGRIRVGYNFQFGDTDKITDKKNPEGRLNLGVADADGLWTITFDTTDVTDKGSKQVGFSDHYVRARATVALDKALKGAGVDLGDVSLSLFGGYNDYYKTANVYKDGDYADNGYDRMELNVPSDSAQASIVGAKVGYGKLVNVEVAAAPYNDNKTENTHGFSVAATSTPYDGVAVGVAYGHNVRLGKDNIEGGAIYNNGLSATTFVDVAKLAKQDDFKLAVAGSFLYGFEDDDLKQDALLQGMGRVSGGIDLVDGYVEYAYTTVDHDDKYERQYLRAQANLNVVKGLALDVYYQDSDLTDEAKKDDFEVGAESCYTFGKVDYHLDVKYVAGKNDANKDDNNFVITPWIQIAF